MSDKHIIESIIRIIKQDGGRPQRNPGLIYCPRKYPSRELFTDADFLDHIWALLKENDYIK